MWAWIDSNHPPYPCIDKQWMDGWIVYILVCYQLAFCFCCASSAITDCKSRENHFSIAAFRPVHQSTPIWPHFKSAKAYVCYELRWDGLTCFQMIINFCGQQRKVCSALLSYSLHLAFHPAVRSGLRFVFDWQEQHCSQTQKISHHSNVNSDWKPLLWVGLCCDCVVQYLVTVVSPVSTWTNAAQSDSLGSGTAIISAQDIRWFTEHLHWHNDLHAFNWN